jgi:branched-chain amino acid aminotransferase
MVMKSSNWIWKNGEWVPWAEAQVHVLSHALHYGSSVFEGMRAYDSHRGTVIFRGRAHLERLLHSARVYHMAFPYDVDALSKACAETVVRNELTSAYIRPIGFFGYGTLGINPGPEVPVEVSIAAIEWGAYLGEDALECGIDAVVSSWRRVSGQMMPTSAKAGGNYLSARLASSEARRHGYGEAICLDAQGNLSEGAAENLFLVRDGVLYTPNLSSSLLPGITRDTVLTLAEGLGVSVVETALGRDALYTAEEIFLTGTAAEIVPVRSVDGLVVGAGRRGPLTESLQRAFFGLFSGDTPDRHGWLEPVSAFAGMLA